METLNNNTIKADDWTLFDKVMYGGLGYGSFCLPTDFFKVILAILFPPLGEVCNIVEDTVSIEFPYINWKSLKVLFEYDNMKRIIYSFILTTLFYIPGLVYTLTNIVEKERNVNYNNKPKYWSQGQNEARYQKTKAELETAGLTVSGGTQYVSNEIASGSQDIGMDIGNRYKETGVEMANAYSEMGNDIGNTAQNIGSDIGSLF
jgi:uncharacterized membrane protein YqaE (UPF0057 family)